jgi:hypothetical protein
VGGAHPTGSPRDGRSGLRRAGPGAGSSAGGESGRSLVSGVVGRSEESRPRAAERPNRRPTAPHGRFWRADPGDLANPGHVPKEVGIDQVVQPATRSRRIPSSSAGTSLDRPARTGTLAARGRPVRSGRRIRRLRRRARAGPAAVEPAGCDRGRASRSLAAPPAYSPRGPFPPARGSLQSAVSMRHRPGDVAHSPRGSRGVRPISGRPSIRPSPTRPAGTGPTVCVGIASCRIVPETVGIRRSGQFLTGLSVVETSPQSECLGVVSPRSCIAPSSDLP